MEKFNLSDQEKELLDSLREKLVGNGRMVNLLSDAGFKRVFGTEKNKRIPIMFLNHILKQYIGDTISTIEDITFLNTEQVPMSEGGKKIIYDILCKDTKGNEFIVEMQRKEDEKLYDRLLYYSGTSMIRQGRPGWNYDLTPSFLICICDFKSKHIPHYRTDHSFNCLQDGKQYFNNCTIVLLQLGWLDKKFADIENIDELWGYLIKNIVYMKSLPKEVEEKFGKEFNEFFEAVDLNKMTRFERDMYEMNVRDILMYKVMEYEEQQARLEELEKAREEAKMAGLEEGKAKGEAIGKTVGMAKGKVEGKAEGKAEIAKSMKNKGLSIELIAEYTGLSIAEINSL